jgi:16S rRNA C1402 (ribose-2'-O) methylase RsmI
VFGPGQSATLAANLTLPGEHIYRGRIKEISNEAQGLKAEFILILHK